MRFIILEYSKLFTKLHETNSQHIDNEDSNELMEYPFKTKIRCLLKQFEDIKIKFNKLDIEKESKNEEERKFYVDDINLLISQINKIIQNFNSCFEEHLNNTVIEGNFQEEEFNRKYGLILRDFKHIDEKIKKRKQEKLDKMDDKSFVIEEYKSIINKYNDLHHEQMKYINDKNVDINNLFKSKFKHLLVEFKNVDNKLIQRKNEQEKREFERKQQELQKIDTIINLNQISKQHNYLELNNNQCKVCSCKNVDELIELLKDNEITFQNGTTQPMYDAFIECLKQYWLEPETSILNRLSKMRLTGSRLIMVTPADLNNSNSPLLMNSKNQAKFLVILQKLNDLHSESLQSEQFECLEWKDEYFSPIAGGMLQEAMDNEIDEFLVI